VARRGAIFKAVRYHPIVPLIRVDPREGSIESLQARLDERDATLKERAEDLARTKTDLEAFRIRYARDVGYLHEELDGLLDALAGAEFEIRDEERERSAAPQTPSADRTTEDGAEPAKTPGDDAPRYTSDAIRKLFRDVAKTIHPDLSHDADARDQRHALMVEANRAYAMGDLEQLRRILALWEGRPEAVHGTGPEAMRERLVRRIAQIDAQLAACAEELEALAETPLWRLKAMVDEASAKGKDLMADMIRRLERDILAARNRLEAIRWQP
jgi:hypothetical protein